MVVREFINKIGFTINETEFRTVESKVNSLKGRMQRFGTLATAFLTAPFIGLNLWIGKTLSEFEQLDVAFETMLGSADKANKLVQDMLNFAAKTPFEIKEIGPTVKQLLAVGIESDKVLETLKSLGDVAAGLSVPVSRLALNFGQIKTQSKLTGRELRDFAIAGVPLTAELAKMLGVSEKAIQKMVSQGKIGFKEVDQAFKNMTSGSGKFSDLMIKQSKTLGGLWSNFKDLITLTVRDYQKQLLPMFKGIVQFLIKLLDFFKNRLSPTMKKSIFIITALAAAIGPLILVFTALVKIGMVVRTTFLAIAAAAKVANLSTSLFMLKFALMGAAVIAILLLGLGIFEDITVYLKGGDSLIGKVIAKLSELNKKLKEMGIFTLEGLKNTLKAADNMIQSFMDFIVGLFTGKWKFALDSVKNIFMDFINTISTALATLIQTFIDPINKLTGNKINITDMKANISKLTEGFTSAREKAGGIIAEVGRNIVTPVPLGAGSGLGLTGQTSLNTEINLTVGENTTPSQIKEIGTNVEVAVERAFQRHQRSLVNAFPKLE